MRRRLAILLPLVFLFIAALACGGDGGIQPSGGETVTLTVFNESSEAICFVYISPSESDDWGDDVLGDDVIEPGESYTFEVIVGTYDLMAEGCDGNAIAVESEVDLSEPKEWTFSDA